MHFVHLHETMYVVSLPLFIPLLEQQFAFTFMYDTVSTEVYYCVQTNCLLIYTFKKYAHYMRLNFGLNLENIITKFLFLSYGQDQEYDIEPVFYHMTTTLRGFVLALKWLV